MEKWIKINDVNALYHIKSHTVTRGVKGGLPVYIYKLDKKSDTWVQRRNVNVNTLYNGKIGGYIC